jgi:uncharacterized protein HemY
MTIVNLNKFRKAKQKAAKTTQAAENRTKHGRTKAEKARDAEDEARRNRLLDGASRDGDDAQDE